MNFNNLERLSLSKINLSKKRVFLRADLNVPIKNTKILQDFKLEAILPTIDFILKKDAKIILASHIGRPEPGNKADLLEKSLSTQILIPWFKNRGYDIDYEPDLIMDVTKSHQKHNSILLLENLRFFAGEKESKNSLKFAELLANTADIYVNDAFGNIHRSDTSMTLLAQKFAPENRSLGLLIEKEITNLEKIRLNKSQDFIVVLGGMKIKDKIPMLENFMTSTDARQKAKAILIGGALAFAFLKAKGLNVENINLDDQTVDMAKGILASAQQHGVEIILPVDQATKQKDSKISNSAHLAHTEIFDIEKIPANVTYIDIGPKTIDLFSQEIKKSKVIFTNGTMGIYENPEGQSGTRDILHAIATSNAFKVVGGGDATAATCIFGLQNKMNFLSTGGGATLKYLGCKDPFKDMPALQAMIE